MSDLVRCVYINVVMHACKHQWLRASATIGSRVNVNMNPCFYSVHHQACDMNEFINIHLFGVNTATWSLARQSTQPQGIKRHNRRHQERNMLDEHARTHTTTITTTTTTTTTTTLDTTMHRRARPRGTLPSTPHDNKPVSTGPNNCLVVTHNSAAALLHGGLY